ncbi:aggrecan core -like [Chlorella sorokiniana]|uniref:Aggrecan core-like n=1 Tax=Chlorella sorokiniana TaxID=3076 RepID=A0A2P6TY15_CHLSO|nr:aggrecan core -like [Chlorella sorokiniana]|eukprot:PRW58938.1 aggrecan core -like [Chlorella sorokiniana]
MARAGPHVVVATALVALLLAGGAAATGDAASALVEMMSGDVSLLSDDSLSSLFLAMTEASRSPSMMQSIQTVARSGPAPSTTTTDSPGSGAGSEAAVMGDLFSALFAVGDSPLSTFLTAAGDGGMSTQLAALLGPSSSAAASATSASGIPTLRSSLGSLLGTAGVGGTSSGSNPFSALLQPVASTRSILSQLADAVEQANSVLAAPHWDDLLGGVDLTRFLNSNRTVLREMMVAMEEVEEQVCKHPYIEWGKSVPSHCDGHNITLAIDGGSCTISHKDHSVTCRPPRVRLIKTPASCTKKHTTPIKVVGKECKIVKHFGDTKEGFLKAPHNKTVVLDFSEPTAPRLVRSAPTASTGSGSSKSSKAGLASRLADGLAAMRERLPRWIKK